MTSSIRGGMLNTSGVTTLCSNISLNVTIGVAHHDPFVSQMGYGWDVVFGVILVLIILSGSLLNVTVLWTLLGTKSRQLNRSRNANTDYYIIALATSDLLVVVLCYPMAFASTASHAWLFEPIGCEMNGFLGFLFSLSDVGILTTMSIVRLLSVKMPHCALVTLPRYTIATLVGVAVYAFGFAVPPLLGWGSYAPEPFGTSCTVAWKSSSRSYVTSVFIFVLAVPFFTMLVCYGCVVYHMRLSEARFGRYLNERKRRSKSQTRLLRMAVLMCVCFILTWLPYSVFCLCFTYLPSFEVHPVQSAVPTVLAKFSHVINPLIYFTMNPNYRRRVNYFFCSNSNKRMSDDISTKKCSIQQTTKNQVSTTSFNHSCSLPLIHRDESVHNGRFSEVNLIIETPLNRNGESTESLNIGVMSPDSKI